jgi:hypothetical protein
MALSVYHRQNTGFRVLHQLVVKNLGIFRLYRFEEGGKISYRQSFSGVNSSSVPARWPIVQVNRLDNSMRLVMVDRE